MLPSSNHFLISMMGKKRKQLSHAEIWDDSALVQSWDEALAEYKVPHNTSLDIVYLLIRRSSITAYMRVVKESKT